MTRVYLCFGGELTLNIPLRRFLILPTLAAFSLALSVLPCRAQSFQPGEIVQAKAYGEPVQVKVVKQDSSGVQVLLKDWQDGTFKEGGSTRYYSPSELSRIGAASSGAAAASAGYGGNASGGSASAGGGGANVPAAPADLGGTGLLSKQQIVDYLRANVGTDGPHPRKEEVNAAVVEAIKKRGVNFKYSWQDLPDFTKAGGTQVVSYALQDNFGPPASQKWLIGPWELQFTNATGFFASRDSAAKMGFVSIEPGHTYIWKIHQDDPPNQWIDGKWREATAAEMKYQGGAGVVLLDGEQHWDWIVHKDMTANSGDWINVADINTRQVIRSGVRKLH